MKFRDGYWGLKSGIRLHNPVEVRDVRVNDGKLTVFSASRKLRHRGDTLNTAVLTTEYSSPAPDIIHVRTYHFRGGVDRGPHFDLQPDADVGTVERQHELATFTSGALSVRVRTGGEWETRFSYAGRYLTEVRGKLSGHVLTADENAFMCEYLGLSVGEQVYGLGERFTPFVKNGQVVDIWNEDGGTSSEQAYKNVPFYLSSRGYGVLVANPGRVSFEVASEVVSAVQFSVPGEVLDYYVIGGNTLKEVLGAYTAFSGRPALPPAWSFGLWLTTSFTTDYDEETVNHFVDGMAEREIPLHVFHFDCFWMKEFQWVDFEWDLDQFPDPAAMLRRLKARGLHVCVWINPYVAQKSRLFDEGLESGFLVKSASGGVWQWDRWQAGMALVDFTNPDAAAWYQSALQKLLDIGVDTFKTDFGERIPTDVVYSDNSDPEKMHNFYTYLYNKTVFELLERNRGKNEALVFARSATVGSQKFPVHWGGDCSATYESMAETLRGGLSLSLSGFGFWSHDISGFENTATPDLFKRWIAFGTLSSHSRLHGNESYRVPWNFDEESNEVLSFFVRQKCRLMPYLFAQAAHASRNGVPMMRPMVLEFSDDGTTPFLDQQYMLGDSLLVAPVFNPEGEISYYLPQGVWTNYITGQTVTGGRWITEKHGYASLPLMVRPSSVVAVGREETRPDYDYTDGVCFHIFELAEGTPAQATVVSLDGEQRLIVRAERNRNSFTVSLDGITNSWSVCLRGVAEVADVDGGTVTVQSLGAVVTAHPAAERIVIRLG